MRNWTIKKKMHLGFGFVSLLVVFFATLVIVSIMQFSSRIDEYRLHEEEIRACLDLRSKVSSLMQIYLQASLTRDGTLIEQEGKKILEDAQADLSRLLKTEKDRKAVEKITAIQSDLAAAWDNGNAMFASYRANGAGNPAAFGECSRVCGRVLAGVSDLVAARQARAREMGNSLHALTVLAIRLILVSIVLVVFFNFALSHFIARGITRPLMAVIGTADEIARGKILQKEITIESSDEIGSLEGAFNRMLKNLGDLVNRAELISRGAVGADQAEARLKESGSVDDSVFLDSSDGQDGDLAHAFNIMQAELRKLAVQARRIAADDLNNPLLNLKISGELGTEFSRIVVTLRDLADLAVKISEGDLTVRVGGGTGVVSSAFSQMVLNLRNLINEVRKQADMVGNSSSRLNSVSEYSQKMIVRLSVMIGKVSSAASSVTDNTRTALTIANDADAASRRGKELMIKLVDKIGIIKSVSESSASAMSKLSARSAEIGEIVNIITKISDQTNLLSLTAAIEAARAGEAGRGFAVVADEVRKLAESSVGAAQKISEIITLVQRETREAATSVERGQKEIEEGEHLSEEASTKFEDIVSCVRNISSEIERMSDSVREIADSAEESKATTREQLKSMQDLTTFADQLAGAVQILQIAMERFRT
ncbi:MAG: methyl-accepting chemotaxis protein [Endomicrobiales bacterium]